MNHLLAQATAPGYMPAGVNGPVPTCEPNRSLAYQLEDTNEVLYEAAQMAVEIKAVLFGEIEPSCDQSLSAKEQPCIENALRKFDLKAHDVRSDLRFILERLRG